MLSGLQIVVVGLGRSGVAAARLCLDRAARVVVTDIKGRDTIGEAAGDLERRGATLCLGGHDAVDWNKADLVVVSPGVPPLAALDGVERSGREVIGETELASRFITAPMVLVGGTNGKSTVTSWVAAMLSTPSRRVFVGGNLGTPLAEVVGQHYDILVVEISSFQAERIPTLHAQAAALLNVTDDHLDRYPDFRAYAQAKGNMFVRMTPNDAAVLPAGDLVCQQQASRGAARPITFGADGDIAVEGPWIVDRVHGGRFPVAGIQLSGKHNLLNACASVGLAAAMGASHESIDEGLRSFRGLEHRTTRVAAVRGVTFYDDSKGTNVGASVAALRGLAEPKAVLIAGGRDKLGSYDPLVDMLKIKGRALVVIGEAADRIRSAASGHLTTVKAGSMQEAVRTAFDLAQPGDAVLLSPACSSFDMFADYKHRGGAFCEAVTELQRFLGAPRRDP